MLDWLTPKGYVYIAISAFVFVLVALLIKHRQSEILLKLRVMLLIETENVSAVFTRCKLIIYLLGCTLLCMVSYLLLRRNWENIKDVLENPNILGLVGTLLGTIIGGTFSLLGSIYVGKQQIKAQTQIRRKNVIYKPLYDELVEIHTVVLKENPYPRRIAFEKEPSLMHRQPQYTAWGRIKADSRYLETPAKLVSMLDMLYMSIEDYLSCFDTASADVVCILNEILMRESETTCTIHNIGENLLSSVLADENFNLFERYSSSLITGNNLGTESETRIASIFRTECRASTSVLILQEKYTVWMQWERNVIALLSAMIKRINITYEE